MVLSIGSKPMLVTNASGRLPAAMGSYMSVDGVDVCADTKAASTETEACCYMPSCAWRLPECHSGSLSTSSAKTRRAISGAAHRGLQGYSRTSKP